MKNFGFISKKKIAKEIAKMYEEYNQDFIPPEKFVRNCEVQSALNALCYRLGLYRLHLKVH